MISCQLGYCQVARLSSSHRGWPTFRVRLRTGYYREMMRAKSLCPRATTRLLIVAMKGIWLPLPK